MLKKLYDKSRIWFAVGWIVAYCVLLSVGDSLSEALGIEKSITLIIGIILSATLIFFLKKNGLFKTYGLCRSKARAKSMLYYGHVPHWTDTFKKIESISTSQLQNVANETYSSEKLYTLTYK